MTSKYTILVLVTIVSVSIIGTVYAIDPIQNDKKKTAVLFQAINMNVTSTNGWELVDFGKKNGVSSGFIFFSERLFLLNGERTPVYLDSFGTGIVVGGKTDGKVFEVHTLSNSRIYGPIELIFTGLCDVSVGMGTFYTDFQVTWKQASKDTFTAAQITDIQPYNGAGSHFESICQTP